MLFLIVGITNALMTLSQMPLATGRTNHGADFGISVKIMSWMKGGVALPSAKWSQWR